MKKYKGTFNYFGERQERQASGVNINQAYYAIVSGLAKHYNTSKIFMFGYFRDKSKYELWEVEE